MKFGFVEDGEPTNEIGIDKYICVGYKSVFQISGKFLRKMIDNIVHLF